MALYTLESLQTSHEEYGNIETNLSKDSHTNMIASISYITKYSKISAMQYLEKRESKQNPEKIKYH